MEPQLILAFFSLPFLVLPNVANNTNSFYWIRIPSVDNFVFDEHLLWSVPSKSRLECAQTCAEDVNCTTFTFTAVPSDFMRCRGHSEQLKSGGTNTAATKLYNLVNTQGAVSSTGASQGLYYLGSTWLTKPCNDNGECSQPNTECFASQCLCTPGYYFSASQDSCNVGCTAVQQTFVKYDLWYISLNNLDSSTITWSECYDWCLSLPACVTFEFNYDQSKCYVAAVTALDVPSAWSAATANLSYWQRTCA